MPPDQTTRDLALAPLRAEIARLAAQRDALVRHFLGPWNDWGNRWTYRSGPGLRLRMAETEAGARAAVDKAVKGILERMEAPGQ